MARIIRSVSLTAALLVLAACTDVKGFDSIINIGCVANPAEHTAGVNWSKARKVDLTIQDGTYSPLGIYFKVGQPSILRVVNKDDSARRFNDNGFLASVAMAETTIGGKKQKGGCIRWVNLGAGSTAEFRFVPVSADTFYHEDITVAWKAALPGPGAMESKGGGFGVITVKP